MTQNKLIMLLGGILLIVIAASAFVLLQSTPPPINGTPSSSPEASSGDSAAASGFELKILQQQAYQLLNKQLIREGALPVSPAAAPGKANPFL